LAFAITAFAWLWLAPSASQAGCSHYVTEGARPPIAWVDVVLHDLNANGVIPPAHDPGRRGPAPCSGPSCSGGAPLAPSVPISPPSVRAQEWGCLAQLGAARGNGARFLLDRGECGRPVRRAASIDRPPRNSFASLA
jgi:hypothetical protein